MLPSFMSIFNCSF